MHLTKRDVTAGKKPNCTSARRSVLHGTATHRASLSSDANVLPALKLRREGALSSCSSLAITAVRQVQHAEAPHLMEVEHDVKLCHGREEVVEHFHKQVNGFKDRELVVAVINAHDKVQVRVAAEDQLVALELHAPLL